MKGNLTESLSSTGKSKYRSSDLVAIKVGIKFNPASIALYYKVKSEPSNKFLHKVDVQKEINQGASAEIIYNRLIKHEPAYWNPNIVAKKQLLNLIGILLSKDDADSTPSNNNEAKKREGKGTGNNGNTTRDSQDVQPAGEQRMELEPVSIRNTESVSLDSVKYPSISPAVPVSQTSQLVSFKTPPDDQDSPKIKEGVSEVFVEENGKAEPRVEELCDGMESNKKPNPSPQHNFDQAKLDFFKDFKKVFIEELGTEALMDSAGNLYDMDGKHIGQADFGEEDSPNGPEEGSMDKGRLREFEKVFVEELGQEVYMDPSGKLYGMDGKYLGQAEQNDEEA
eukprot:TRINITY_DN4118_c0_g1_i1.p1 TRINITY_DN4118_c0_g1~~TRINITY_DN4118_c0_g1_i1.p1  ORF type:complete len:338 (-),score=119.13 TRINITY_DN4118_c0_g1_i1:100-1113(-)